MEYFHEMLDLCEQVLPHCTLPLSDARKVFVDHRAWECIQTRMKQPNHGLNLNFAQGSHAKNLKDRRDLRGAINEKSKQGKKTFIKERRVYLTSYEMVDNKSISDVYMHIRLWLYERDHGREKNPSVPEIYAVYSYWDRHTSDFWIGVEQEYLKQENTIYEKLYNGLKTNKSEEIANKFLIGILKALRRFQEDFWLIHNDLHLSNMYIRENDSIIIMDFDHASYYIEGTNGQFLSHTYFSYQHTSFWARDVQQVLGEVLNLLTERERAGLDGNVFLEKLRALLLVYGNSEFDTFYSFLDFQCGIPTVSEREKEKLRWFRKKHLGNIRIVSPAVIQFGVVGEFFNARHVAKVLHSSVEPAEMVRTMIKSKTEGVANEWELLEYVSKTLPVMGETAEMGEWNWIPLCPASPNDIDVWHNADTKNFIYLWARYNLVSLWINPSLFYSMHCVAVPKTRRMVFFINVLENLQRVVSLFYESREKFQHLNAFQLLYACHVALFNQTPFCAYELICRFARTSPDALHKSFAPVCTREALTHNAFTILSRYAGAPLEFKIWNAFSKHMCDVAATIRIMYLPNVHVAREKIIAAGSIRSLYGKKEFDEFLDMCGADQENEVLTTHACMAAAHPEIMSARFLNMGQWYRIMNFSQQTFHLPVGSTFARSPQSPR